MPATDPTFQHSDEDWTQITQPRLRKRVQNRVSQRKHRNKVRQQRAESIDAGQRIPAPLISNSYWPPHCSHNSSAVGDYQQHRHGSDPPQQQQLQTTRFREIGGIETFNDNGGIGAPEYASSQSPWIGSMPSIDPQAATYPAISSNIPNEYTYIPYTYGQVPVPSARRPPVSSSAHSSAYGIGPNGADTSQYDTSQQWYNMPATNMPSDSFSAHTSSTCPSSHEYPQHSTYNLWHSQPSDCSAGAAAPLDFTEPTNFNDSGYYLSNTVSSATGRSGVTNTTLPAYGTATASHIYPSDGISTPFHEGLEPRGSGIDPSCYKPSKHQPSGSRSKRSQLPHYR